MKTSLKLLAALLASAGLAGSLTVRADPGEVIVFNESASSIKPWFKSKCWARGIGAGPTTWVDFGNIGAAGAFGWNFDDPGMLAPDCRDRGLAFTYTRPGEPPPATTPPPGRVAQMFFGPRGTTYIQVGGRMDAFELD